MSKDILVPNNLVVCDKYGIGTVKSLYEDKFKGEDADYVHIYFKNLEMDYRGPIANLKYREINKASNIKKLFKEDIATQVRELIALNFNLQQSKMTAMMEKGTLEDVVFLLRYLYCKKGNSVINSLCAYDDALYKKCLTNLSDELSVASENTYAQSLEELKKLLQKNNITVKIDGEADEFGLSDDLLDEDFDS